MVYIYKNIIKMVTDVNIQGSQRSGKSQDILFFEKVRKKSGYFIKSQDKKKFEEKSGKSQDIFEKVGHVDKNSN